jgi:uncharacterized surface protein with fasciclin (FAS1) repeats
MKRTRIRTGVAVFAMAIAFGAAAGLEAQVERGGHHEMPHHDMPHEGAGHDLWMGAHHAGFEEWSQAFHASGMAEHVGDGAYTAFIADDDAYGMLPENRREVWVADPGTQRQAVAHTVIEGRLTLDDLRQRDHVVTVDGDHIPVRTDGERVWIGDSEIVRADLPAGASTIHQLDSAIWPEEPEATRPQQPVEVNEPMEPEHERRPEATHPQHPPVVEPRPEAADPQHPSAVDPRP